jgi:hypothetical protein
MKISEEDIQERVLEEHQGIIKALNKYGISHIVYNNDNDLTPDAVFANNWISVHPKLNKMFIYPMFLENRRLEVREDIIQYIKHNYPLIVCHDLRGGDKKALEGTGSMVMDHDNKVIYASISPRTNESILSHVGDILNYKIISFYTEYHLKPVYHTNIMMAIGKSWIVVCMDVIEKDDMEEVWKSLKQSNKTIIKISISQMECYCGNIFEISNNEGNLYTIMSTCAKKAFMETQLEKLGIVIDVPLDTIETYGGGGIRCCLTSI